MADPARQTRFVPRKIGSVGQSGPWLFRVIPEKQAARVYSVRYRISPLRFNSAGGRPGSADARFEGEYQSMRSAPCPSEASHPLHAMPPRITRNSDRPRASDRTMVNIVLFNASFALQLCHQQPRPHEKWDNTLNLFTDHQTELAGYRERISSARGGAFFLTSLFIELIDLPEGF